MPKILIEIDTDTQVVVPRESFILVKNKLQDATVTPMCCMQPDVDYDPVTGEPQGQYCCGNQDADWPPDVAEMLSKCDEILDAAPQPAQQPPIPTSERLPTQDDADCQCDVWAYQNKYGWDLYYWASVRQHPDMFIFWLPTGLKMPPAPGGEG